ncbi:hypothetical protein R5R35_010448 [Gryllus longicercus]|uniref:Uncharacterized protein n=1 Tax=Gryllus longicercus TaxID=2509291 RepID=A0AAN9WFQ8_9ORTH
MLGSLVQRLTSLSPLTSPVASPRPSRPRGSPGAVGAAPPPPPRRSPAALPPREVQSDPEDPEEGGGPASAAAAAAAPARRRRRDKGKAAAAGALPAAGPLHGSKSLGRLDGMKEVSTYFK